jgi:ribosomal protein L22
MIAKAKGNFLRLKPMNVRQVIDLIRGKDVASSLVTLAQLEKGATGDDYKNFKLCGE